MNFAGSRSDTARRLRAPAIALLLCLAAIASLPLTAVGESQQTSEIRAMWVLRTSLATPASIETLVRSARDNGFNTLLVQVRGRGDAYFARGLEPRAAELLRQAADFDPLASVLAAGHAAGLRVHAWVNVNLVASAVELPFARDHLVYRHPEWLMVPRELAQELAAMDRDSPAYVGKLARWTRTLSNEIEGLYASPLVPAAADHIEAVVRDLSRRYAVDGVHLDYARYPNDRFDYSRAAIREFRAYIRPRVEAPVRRELDARQTDDLLAWPDARPDDWRTFRVARMTALVSRLRAAVKTERPRAVLSVATAPDVREAYEQRLQDWRTWLENGIIDVVCPMAYTPEADKFEEQIAAAGSIAGGRAVWAGIGAYRLSPARTVENIHTARRLGAAGVILFSYDSMTSARQTPANYLGLVGRAAFAQLRSSSGNGTR